MTWQKVTVPYNYYINVKFYSPNVGFITEDYGKTFQTSNGGVSWIQLNKPYSVSGIELFGNDLYAFGGSGVIMKKKVEYSPAKDKLLQDRNMNEINKFFPVLGLSVVQDENFFIDLNK